MLFISLPGARFSCVSHNRELSSLNRRRGTTRDCTCDGQISNRSRSRSDRPRR